MSSFDKDSLSNTFIVAIGICLVCSIVVSGIAVALKPTQQANKILDQKQNILRAAGLLGRWAGLRAAGGSGLTSGRSGPCWFLGGLLGCLAWLLG